MTPFQNYHRDPGLVRRLVVGAALVRRAIDLRSAPQGPSASFWETLNWWWEETHVNIPLELLERQTEWDLIQSFLVERDGGVGFSTAGVERMTFSSNGAIGLGTTAPSTRLLVGLLPGDSEAGMWEWEGIKVSAEKPPHPLRVRLISLITGAEWKPAESPSQRKTGESSITPYGRLSRLSG